MALPKKNALGLLEEYQDEVPEDAQLDEETIDMATVKVLSDIPAVPAQPGADQEELVKGREGTSECLATVAASAAKVATGEEQLQGEPMEVDVDVQVGFDLVGQEEGESTSTTVSTTSLGATNTLIPHNPKEHKRESMQAEFNGVVGTFVTIHIASLQPNVNSPWRQSSRLGSLELGAASQASHALSATQEEVGVNPKLISPGSSAALPNSAATDKVAATVSDTTVGNASDLSGAIWQCASWAGSPVSIEAASLQGNAFGTHVATRGCSRA